MARILMDYLVSFVICTVVIVTFARYVPGLSKASGPLVTVVSAMIAGQLFGRRMGEPAESAFYWRVAGVLTLFSVAAVAGITWGLGWVSRETLVQFINALALIGIMCLLAIRFTFSLAAKQGARSVQSSK